MTFVKGFKTEKEAKEYAKVNGGEVCSKNRNKEDYKISCQAIGLDENKCPYIVMKRGV